VYVCVCVCICFLYLVFVVLAFISVCLLFVSVCFCLFLFVYVCLYFVICYLFVCTFGFKTQSFFFSFSFTKVQQACRNGIFSGFYFWQLCQFNNPSCSSAHSTSPQAHCCKIHSYLSSLFFHPSKPPAEEFYRAITSHSF